MALIPRKRMSSDLLDPKPKKGSFNSVTSDGIFNATGEAIDNILDDGSASESVVVAVPSSQSSNYVVGNYYEVQGKVARLRTKTEGDNVTQLTFDTTSGLLDAMNDIVEDIASIGSPLQWKGPATVSELNTGITGIQPGWTYTLTDAGTLTDGNVKVEAGDEVAWTEDGEWFPLGAENKLKIFEYAYEDGVWQYPSVSDVSSAAVAGKVVYLCENSPAGKTYYQLTYRGSGSGNISVECVNADNGLCIKGYLPNGGSDSWTRESSTLSKNFAPDYSTLTFPITEGTQCVHLGKYYYAKQAIATSEDWTPSHWTQTSMAEQIGNVEALLAAL